MMVDLKKIAKERLCPDVDYEDLCEDIRDDLIEENDEDPDEQKIEKLADQASKIFDEMREKVLEFIKTL